VKFAFIRDHLRDYPITAACQALKVSRTGYYAWRDRPPSARALWSEAMLVKIQTVHAEHRLVYGSPRVWEALVAAGESVCVNTVAKLMKQRNIRAKTKKKFVPTTTDSAHDHPVAKNRLQRRFTAGLPNQKWVTDITYIPTDEGWLYLAGVMDLCSRKIVGWSMAEHMETSLVIDALTMAIGRRSPKAGLLHHSDRGSQYASDDYQEALEAVKMTCSMSGRGECWDNAPMESFWATLKTELVHHERYATRQQAKQSIFEYIEVFYNRKRLHSALGYRSPEMFEASLN
jgi:transposase InsO family protein